jgi:hypothetical protein
MLLYAIPKKFQVPKNIESTELWGATAETSDEYDLPFIPIEKGCKKSYQQRYNNGIGLAGSN